MKSINWIKPDIKNLDSLETSHNLTGSLYILFYFLLLIGTGSLTYYTLNSAHYLFVLIMLFLHGSFYSFLGWSGIRHELIHNNVFKNRSLNSFFLKLFSILWGNYVYFKESHMRHHKYTLYTNLDREVVLPLNPNYKNWIFLFTFDIPNFYRTLKALIYNSCGKLDGIWVNELFKKKDTAKKKQLIHFARMILLSHIFFILVFILTKQYELILIISLAPFIANWLNRMMGMSQHIGMQGNVNDFRLNSTSIKLNWFLSMLYSNMNYHIEHHLYPKVPFYNLPKLNKELSEFLPPQIDGFWNLLRHIIKKNNSTSGGSPA